MFFIPFCLPSHQPCLKSQFGAGSGNSSEHTTHMNVAMIHHGLCPEKPAHSQRMYPYVATRQYKQCAWAETIRSLSCKCLLLGHLQMQLWERKALGSLPIRNEGHSHCIFLHSVAWKRPKHNTRRGFSESCNPQSKIYFSQIHQSTNCFHPTKHGLSCPLPALTQPVGIIIPVSSIYPSLPHSPPLSKLLLTQ